ncbi:MAG TPA: tetratricopeptide repeat protein [Anaerolineales bacterium]|nr:tetratricopeptide repeat protein [Anaerolineales bacterium]
MTRRRKRPNFFGWAIFGLVLLFGYYINQVYLPAQPNPFEATPTPTRSPESFVTEAQSLYQQGKLLQAIEAYEEAIKSSPQDPTLYIALARVQVFAGLAEEAQANAENAILLSPNNSMAHAVRAWALDFQEGENSNALEAIDKALELDPNNAIAHAYRTEILIDSQLFDNIDKAREVSRTALALDPNALETRRARGYIFEATGDYENAIQFYKSAIEVNPNLSILHMELGRNLRFLQVYDDAIKEFTLANTLDPSDPEPDYLIARTYATIGEYEKALQYAETAVNDDLTNPRYRGNYGVMFYRNFKYAEAVEQLSLAVNGGKTEDGFPIQGLALNDDPRIGEFYFTYGLALARTNQCGQALPIAQTLQTKFPEDEIVLEAATAIIGICQENLENPAVDTPVATEAGTSILEVTDTARATDAPEVTLTSTP